MSFQKYELFKNNNLRLIQPRPANAGWSEDKKPENTCRFFPRTFYRYNNKVYKADNSILEYDKSIVFKRLINVENDKDIVLFYDKKTFDTSVERFKSYSRKGTTRKHKSSGKTFNIHNSSNEAKRTVTDKEIDDIFVSLL